MNEKREEKKQETLAPVVETEKKMDITELDDAQAEQVAGGGNTGGCANAYCPQK